MLNEPSKRDLKPKVYRMMSLTVVAHKGLAYPCLAEETHVPRSQPLAGSSLLYWRHHQEVGVTTQVQLTTADELLRMPDDGYRYELTKWDLKKMAPAGNEHGMLSLKLAAKLWYFVEANKLGTVYAAETGFKLTVDPDTVRAPDAAFISQKRLDEVGPVQGYWPGAPNLAAEVVSPNDLFTEVSEKVAEWLAAGSGMVVVVNPRRHQVLVHAPGADVKVLGLGDTLEGGEVVPGWQLPISELFDA